MKKGHFFDGANIMKFFCKSNIKTKFIRVLLRHSQNYVKKDNRCIFIIYGKVAWFFQACGGMKKTTLCKLPCKARYGFSMLRQVGPAGIKRGLIISSYCVSWKSSVG